MAVSKQTNGIDVDVATPYLNRVENLEEEIESERSAFMKKCKSIRGDIKDVLDEAKDAGVPKKALKAIVAKRKLERKINKLADNLDEEDEVAFEQLAEALGTLIDLPLGEAALAAHGGNGSAPAPVGDQPSTEEVVSA